MVVLNIIADGTKEPSGPSFDARMAIHIKTPITVMGIPKGTVGGLPTVMFRAKMPDGQDVFFETTLALFTAAADALRSYYSTRIDR